MKEILSTFTRHLTPYRHHRDTCCTLTWFHKYHPSLWTPCNIPRITDNYITPICPSYLSYINMQSPMPGKTLPQFSSVALSNSAQPVPTRVFLSNVPQQPKYPIGALVRTRPLSDSSFKVSSNSSSAFQPISAERPRIAPSSFTHIDSSIQFPSFKPTSQKGTVEVHTLKHNAEDDFFLLSPIDAHIDSSGAFESRTRRGNLRGLHLKETKAPRVRGNSTRTLRKPKIFLQPRLKKTPMYI